MKYPRLVIAATGSGSGKTTITCGILGALQQQGLKPCSFKAGPDYIDPMFHRNVLKVPSGNLDTFFTDEETTLKLFTSEYDGDIAIIEGVMGLYDGLGGVEEQGSTYDLAKVLKAPIILVVNARGKGKSLLAEIKGFLDYDTEGLIKGVILNKVSAHFAKTIGQLIEEELGIAMVGYVENNQDVSTPSRHLGLVIPEELESIQKMLELEKVLVSAGVDIDLITDIANKTDDLPEAEPLSSIVYTNPVKLAVARDEAFCFYYKENLQLLKDSGVSIQFFSPLKDSCLPEGINGILLGGGYPEEYLKQLSENASMKESIKKAIEKGMPIMAECGGFMYLLDSIEDKEKNTYEMVGALKGKAFWSGKLVRFGYVSIDNNSGEIIKGHEFHYYDTDNNGGELTVIKPSTGSSYKACHRLNGGYVGFPHLYYPSNMNYVKSFVEVMKNYGGK